jgi:hypothetical protein
LRKRRRFENELRLEQSGLSGCKAGRRDQQAGPSDPPLE